MKCNDSRDLDNLGADALTVRSYDDARNFVGGVWNRIRSDGNRWSLFFFSVISKQNHGREACKIPPTVPFVSSGRKFESWEYVLEKIFATEMMH